MYNYINLDHIPLSFNSVHTHGAATCKLFFSPLQRFNPSSPGGFKNCLVRFYLPLV